jgi:hypothetical protein
LEPLIKHKFRFDGSTNKLNLKFEESSALFIILVLEPHHEDRLIELTSISVYGTTIQASPIATREILYKIPQ